MIKHVSADELGISTGTVIDFGQQKGSQLPTANSLTFGWSSSTANAPAAYKMSSWAAK